MSKINWKKSLYFFVWLLAIGLLVYSRFINLGWGLPYPMHPDERNMANAVQNLNCEISNCLNPHFFAYGQLSLYLGYIGVLFMKFFDGNLRTPISFQESVFSLRIISAIASVITAFVLYKILFLLIPKKGTRFTLQITSFLIFIFSPVLIQFAHFGTTESLLIMFYSTIIYCSLLYVQKKLLTTNYLLLTSFICGLALATKISSVIFLFIPLWYVFSQSWRKGIFFILLTFFVFALFSPYNFISFGEFINSLKYESYVATGKSVVFYTRQFRDAQPIIFQMTKVFPYALGLPVFILGILGLLTISWKKKKVNLLRFAFVLVFLPNAFMYAKWTRFMAPAFPLMIIFASVFLKEIKVINIIKIIIIIITILPGLAYLSVYRQPDVRFTASEWIYKNIPSGSLILSETANVIDLPLEMKSYQNISFNFYDLDQEKDLQQELSNNIKNADYIIVPSRRIFKNHSKEKYPLLSEYYKRLFSGKLGFKQVAEFTSYPGFKFQSADWRIKFKMEFPDENAEETWTVFDHPVIKVYKRI